MVFVFRLNDLEEDGEKEEINTPGGPPPKLRKCRDNENSQKSNCAINVVSALISFQCHNGIKCKSPNQTLQGYHDVTQDSVKIRPWFCPHCYQLKLEREKSLEGGGKRVRS